MPFLLKYIGAAMIKKLLISWLFEAAFDAIIGYAEDLAKRTENRIDDDAVEKFKENRSVFIKFAKDKI